MNHWRVSVGPTWRWMTIAVLSGIGVLGVTTSTAAQAAGDSSPRASVIVLRSSGADVGSSADPIDAALLRDLTAIGGLEQPQVSPMEYEEIRLNAGCSDQSRQCLAAIAGMAQSAGLVVRLLSKVGGTLQLDVVYFDAASQDEPARASGQGDEAALVARMPSLVRQLFGIPEVVVVPSAASTPVATTAPLGVPTVQPGSARDQRGGVGGLTIASLVTLAVGAGVGLAGIVVGSSASSSFDDYKNTAVTDAESAAAADAAFKDADSKAAVANILMPIGGALLVGGAVMLVIGLRSESGEAQTPHVAIAPTRDGGVVWLAGAL